MEAEVHQALGNVLLGHAFLDIPVGRRVGDHYGAKVSANLYSLIETAKANGLNPYDYLKTFFKELPNVQSVEAIEALLPWHPSTNSDWS